MKLQINELKKFKAVAGTIKQNAILPILSYLKFDNGKIVKSNLESFATMEADFEGSFLVDEKVLMSFVDMVNGKEIEVTVNEKSIILSCGKDKTSSPTEPIENFPAVVEPTEDNIEFDAGMIEQIKVASMFTIEDNSRPFTGCVFIGDGVIAASTGFVAYVKPVDEKYPKIILERNTVAAITKFEHFFFSQTDTYQFFSNGLYTFGFVKKDTQYINMKPFANIPDDVEKVEIDKSEIVSFCDYCVNSSEGRFVIAEIKGNKLLMNESAYSRDGERQLSVELEDFVFNPTIMAKMLKSLPDQKVNFIRHSSKYYITGESDYVALIMEMQLVNNQK